MAIIVDKTTIPGITLITDNVTGGITTAVNYTTELSNIATALGTLATNSTTISTTLTALETSVATLVTNSTSIRTTLSSINTTLASMETNLSTLSSNSTTMTTNGSTTGIHIKSPYDDFTMVSIYKLLIEQGKALDTTTAVSQSEQTAALATIANYVTHIKTLGSF